jgi:hypothetical protein
VERLREMWGIDVFSAEEGVGRVQIRRQQKTPILFVYIVKYVYILSTLLENVFIRAY